MEPGYLQLPAAELTRRIRLLQQNYANCRLCPRACGADRIRGEQGVCGGGVQARVHAASPHFGEERPLVGRGGSGTIFFSHCSLRCEFCQNWEISHLGEGSELSDAELGALMVRVQEMGCHNINLVTPTHFVPNIVGALPTAINLGLRIRLVYNTSGYECLETLRLLDGIIDIYLPDYKYAGAAVAAQYSAGAGDYPEVAEAAIEEMHRQVGDLVVDEEGIALRGLMVRHLVLPQNLAGTDHFVRWVAERLGPRTYVNIMSQYRPEYHAKNFPVLQRRVSAGEYQQALQWAREAGLLRLDAQ